MISESFLIGFEKRAMEKTGESDSAKSWAVSGAFGATLGAMLAKAKHNPLMPAKKFLTQRTGTALQGAALGAGTMFAIKGLKNAIMDKQ